MVTLKHEFDITKQQQPAEFWDKIRVEVSLMAQMRGTTIENFVFSDVEEVPLVPKNPK